MQRTPGVVYWWWWGAWWWLWLIIIFAFFLIAFAGFTRPGKRRRNARSLENPAPETSTDASWGVAWLWIIVVFLILLVFFGGGHYWYWY